MRKLLAFLTIMLTAFAFSAPANAQWGGKKDFIYEKGGYAIAGHDTVAYFDLDRTALKSDGLPIPKAVKGDPQYNVEYEGATWIFVSQENADKFAAEPAKYTPAYNGYCAYAAAKGNLAKTNPNAWRIIDGQLYLNFSSGVQKKWVKDIPGYIVKADGNWNELAGKLKTPGA